MVTAGLSPARAGMAEGPVIQRDGDYFGRTVNLAARLVDRAPPGQVIVAAETAAQIGDEGLVLHEAGVHELAGLPNPMPVFRVDRRGPMS